MGVGAGRMRGAGGAVKPSAHPGAPARPSPSASGFCGHGSARGLLHTAVQPSLLLLLHENGSKPLRVPMQAHCPAPTSSRTTPKSAKAPTEDGSVPSSPHGEQDAGVGAPGAGLITHDSCPMHCEQLKIRHASGLALHGITGTLKSLGPTGNPLGGSRQTSKPSAPVATTTAVSTSTTAPRTAGPTNTLRGSNAVRGGKQTQPAGTIASKLDFQAYRGASVTATSWIRWIQLRNKRWNRHILAYARAPVRLGITAKFARARSIESPRHIVPGRSYLVVTDLAMTAAVPRHKSSETRVVLELASAVLCQGEAKSASCSCIIRAFDHSRPASSAVTGLDPANC
jgi:hypothetical protein